MRRLALALLMVCALAAQASATVTITRRPQGQLPDDWAPFLRFLYRFEEAAGANAIDASGNMGADMTDTATVTRDTTAGHFIEGTSAAGFAKASNQYFTCSDGNCGGSSRADMIGIAMTYGCAFYPTTHTQASTLMSKAAVGTSGWRLMTDTSGHFQCKIGNASAADTVTGSTAMTDGTLHFGVCTTSTAASANINLFIDGASDATAAGTGKLPPDNGSAFEISSSDATIDVDGKLDMCFGDDIQWSTASQCRACAIGIGTGTGTFTNALGVCDPTIPTRYLGCLSDSDCNAPYGICVAAGTEDNCFSSKCCMGRRASCGDCDLPACDIDQPQPPSGVAMPDWSTLVRHVFRHEASPGLLVGEGSITAITLTDHGTITADTTNFREGARSAAYAQGSNQYASCTDASCGGTTKLDFDGATAFTAFCRGRVTAEPTPTNVAQAFLYKLNSSTGYALERGKTCSGSNCKIAFTVNGVPFSTTTGNGMALNTWASLVATADGTNINIYRDGLLKSGPNPSTLLPSNSTADFRINTSVALDDWSGNTDECGVDARAWGPQTQCRWCALFLTGKGECDGVNPGTVGLASYKICSSDADCASGAGVCNATDGRCTGYRAPATGHTWDCGSCFLPACNQATPSTN